MKCFYCKNEMDNYTSFCPRCGKKNKIIHIKVKESKIPKFYKCTSCHNEIPINLDVCPNCGKKYNRITLKGVIKLFIFINLIAILPIILIGIVAMFLIGLEEGFVSFNQFFNIIKYVIYFVISIPLIISLFIISGKILKNSKHKNIISLVLVILSIIGFMSFNSFVDKSKIQFDDYNIQKYITLNGISVPTLYNVTNYDNTMIAMKVKLNEEEIKGEAIALTLKEPLPVEIVNKYKSELLKNNYKLENRGSENEEWYSILENNNYMFIGLTDTLIIYISFDKEDYNAFIESLSNENGKELSIKIF